MTLSEKDIRHVAKLAALEISDEEIGVMQRDLNNILNYIEKLSQVSSRGVVPTSHVHGVVNFFRDDIIRDSFSQESLEQIAPDFSGGCFRVPRII